MKSQEKSGKSFFEKAYELCANVFTFLFKPDSLTNLFRVIFALGILFKNLL